MAETQRAEINQGKHKEEVTPLKINEELLTFCKSYPIPIDS